MHCTYRYHTRFLQGGRVGHTIDKLAPLDSFGTEMAPFDWQVSAGFDMIFNLIISTSLN